MKRRTIKIWFATLTSSLSCNSVEGVVALCETSDGAAECKGGVLSRNGAARLIDVGDIDLDGRVVLGRDKAVQCRTCLRQSVASVSEFLFTGRLHKLAGWLEREQTDIFWERKGRQPVLGRSACWQELSLWMRAGVGKIQVREHNRAEVSGCIGPIEQIWV